MPNPRLLLLSNSKIYGQTFFEWCSEELKSFFAKSSVKTILFIPYAIPEYDYYEELVRPALSKQGLEVESIHRKADPVAAVHESEAIFIGGGNTFLLLKTLYEKNLIDPIRHCVLNKSIPYMGSSAGTNVATRSINTTNDMPICYPPSFEALNLVPFNINPHYMDPDPNSTHMGETRQKRIEEFLQQSDSVSVLGLREGTALIVDDGKAFLHGVKNAKLFKKNKNHLEYSPGSDLSFLLEKKN